MIFFSVYTLMYVVASNLVTPRRVVDTNIVTEFVEDISSEMQFYSEDYNMTEVDVEDMSNATETARRRMRWSGRMRWSNCAVYKGSHPAQYIYLHGKCQHIQSIQTVHNWFGRSVYRKISQSIMDTCKKGDPIRGTGLLMRGHGTPEVYAVFNGKKHHIVNPATMSRCRFNWGKILGFPGWLVESFPTGPSIKA